MIVTISSRHMEVSEPLKQYAEEKSGKLVKYYDRIQKIEVVFENTKERISVEMMVDVEHNHKFIARDQEGDAYACVDSCVAKLERQLTDHKNIFRNRKHAAEDKRG